MIELSGGQQKNYKTSDKVKDFFSRERHHFLSSVNDPALIKRYQQVGQDLSKNYETLCVVGFGGSSLGVKAIYSALDLSRFKNRIVFFDNIDAFDFEKKINALDLTGCHWLFVSKSGQTTEVQAVISYISQVYSQANLSLHSCSSVVTTLNGNPIHLWAQDKDIPFYGLPENIGGRFCVFTSCGFIPMAFVGVDLQDFKKGADWALAQKEMMIQLSDELIASFHRAEWIHLYWSYSESFLNFGLWLQQLWMESLGKKTTIDGQSAPRVSSLFVARGVSDQHSILQQIAEGYKDKFVVFLEDNRSQQAGPKLNSSYFEPQKKLVGQSIGELLRLEKQGTMESLQEMGISCLNLKLHESSGQSIAALMSIYMLVVLAIANDLKVNPLDQPGVESSKLRTKELLSRLNP